MLRRERVPVWLRVAGARSLAVLVTCEGVLVCSACGGVSASLLIGVVAPVGSRGLGGLRVVVFDRVWFSGVIVGRWLFIVG